MTRILSDSLYQQVVEADCEEQGFTTYDYGCNVCPPTFVDGKAVNQRIEARGRWMQCVRCGGNYGEVSA